VPLTEGKKKKKGKIAAGTRGNKGNAPQSCRKSKRGGVFLDFNSKIGHYSQLLEGRE